MYKSYKKSSKKVNFGWTITFYMKESTSIASSCFTDGLRRSERHKASYSTINVCHSTIVRLTYLSFLPEVDLHMLTNFHIYIYIYMHTYMCRCFLYVYMYVYNIYNTKE